MAPSQLLKGKRKGGGGGGGEGQYHLSPYRKSKNLPRLPGIQLVKNTYDFERIA